MRVTKLVREYIEESVDKALSEKSAVEIEYEAFRKELDEFIKQIEDTVEQMVDEAIENYRIVNYIPDDIKIKKTDYALVRYDDWDSAIRSNAMDIKKKRNEAKAKAIKDIMLTLELGGTKADLDAMLSKVATEYKI